MVAMPARARRRTWEHPGPDAARPIGIYRQPCGCWWDGYGDRLWEPCMTHEGEGHLSVLSTGQGPDGSASVARCLVIECAWRTEQAREDWAASAAQEHWHDTRAR